jgi:predicted ATPase
MPLAIELAAAPTPALSPREIVAGLGHRFELLPNGARTARPRHRTLRAPLEWSYHFLSGAARELRSQRSVCAGGITAQAARVVAAGVNDCGTAFLPRLVQLVRQSLGIVDARGDQTRYRLLETIRQFAIGKLSAKLSGFGETEAALERLGTFLRMPASGCGRDQDPVGNGVTAWLNKMEAELGHVAPATQRPSMCGRMG